MNNEDEKRIAELERRVKVLAEAIMELSARAAHAWDYDGEQSVATGIDLSNETEIREISDAR